MLYPKLRRRSFAALLCAVALVLAPLGIVSSGSAAVPAYIVFSSDRGGDGYGIYRMNLDGSGLTRLSAHNAPNEKAPAISPDGTKIAYSSGSSLRVMNADGSGAHTVATSFTWIPSVAWSPDGQKLAYVNAGGSGVWTLHVMNADGTGDEEIVHAPVLRDVTYAPDGNIVYGSSTNASISGRPQIWVIAPDGTGNRLLRQGGFDSFALSPDGRGIVLTANAWTGKATGGLFYFDDINNISDLNYPATTNVWTGEGYVASPSISPDGRILHQHDPEYWLYFDTEDDITVINGDGSGRRKLTSGAANDVDPDWYVGTPALPAAPQVTITGGPAGTITTTRPEFAFSADQTATFECQLTDRTTSTSTGYERCSDLWVEDGTFRPADALTHGAWTFSVRAVGQSGSRSQVASRDFTVDTGDGPKIVTTDVLDFGDTPHMTEKTLALTVTNQGPQMYDGFVDLEGSGRFDFRIVDNRCGPTAVRVTIAAWSTCTVTVGFKPRFTGAKMATLVFEPNLPGQPYHRLTLQGVGTSEAPSAPVIVDAPEYTNDSTPTFEYEGTDDRGDQFECRIYRIDETPPGWTWCSVPQGPFHTSPVELADGEYTFEVRSVDQGSPTPNSDAAGADFVIDTVVPTVTIKDAPTVTDDPRPVFTFSSDEPAEFWCRFDAGDGGDFAPCSGPDGMHRPAEPLGSGLYMFEVQARDRAGNRSAPAVANFEINAEIPQPPTDLSGAAATATTAQVRFNPPDDTAGAMTYEVTCRSSDGGQTATTTTSSSPVTVEDLTTGSTYTCDATSTNAAGTSEPSEPSPPFLQAITPEAPHGVTASLTGPDAAQVSFTPGEDGGAAVTLFEVQCVAEDGRTTHTGSGPGSPVAVDGLEAGTGYACIARATNAVGASPWSDPSDILRVPGDPDPVADINGPDTVNEGDVVAVNATSSTGVGPLTFAWDVDGDGAYDDGTGPQIDVSAVRHGTMTIGLQVTDANGERATTTHTVSVANVAPQVAPIADHQVTEGQALSVDGSFSDPGDNSWTATVDFGDGPESLPLTGRSFTISHPSPTDGPVSVRVCDDAGACDVESFDVEIVDAPVAVVASIGGPTSTDEGTVVTLSAAGSTGTGPLSFAWDTDGDGDYDDGNGVSVDIEALAHGAIEVGLRVTDADGRSTTDDHTLIIRNVAPIVDPIPDQVVAHDGSLAVAGSFADPGANTWTATVDFGDGPRPLILVDRSFTITHSDPSPGTVTVRVCDDAGACHETSFEVDVLSGPAPVAVISGPSTVAEGSSAEFSGDQSTGTGALTFAWDTDGDGDYDDATGADVAVDFPTAGTRTLGLRVTDADGGSSVLQTVTVTAVSPTVSEIDDQQVEPGQEFTVTGSFSDPGTNTWTAIVDYGDGPRPLDLVGQEFTLTHAFEKVGSHRVVVQVCDDHQECGRTSFAVQVSADADAPTTGGVTIPGIGTLPGTGASLGLAGLVLAFILTMTGWVLVRRSRMPE